jgi:hypothetical protein
MPAILEFYRAWTSAVTEHGYTTMCALIVSSGMCQPLAGDRRALPTLDVGWRDWRGAERILASL